MTEDPRSFSPTQVEANHIREQGGGMGQRELSAQKDANETEDAAVPNPNGIEDLETTLEAEGDHQGVGHRPDPAPSDREHGKKTRQRSKDIISGRA